MEIIRLTVWDLAIPACLLAAMVGCSIWQKLDVARELTIAAIRMVAQLLLIGLALRALFAHAHWGWVGLMSIVMLLAAGREAPARQKRRLTGWWSFSVGTGSMFVSSFAVTIFALTVSIQADPWYSPQYAIPVLGMLLGNTMNGIALSMDRFTQTVWQQKGLVEQRLMLGQDRSEAIREVKRESLRSGMIPIINAMAVAGVVSLPGMMTGQILGGNPPVEAVKYQILIWFLIAAGSGFGMMAAVSISAARLFDHRHRLRLDRLR